MCTPSLGDERIQALLHCFLLQPQQLHTLSLPPPKLKGKVEEKVLHLVSKPWLQELGC